MSLRSVSSDNFVVVDITGEAKIIGEVSYTAALTTLHEKAIYLHEAKQFHVERFDYKERKAYVKRVDCDYYTDAIDYTQVKALREFEKRVDRGRRRARAWRRAGEPADRRASRRSSSTRMKTSARASSRCPSRRCIRRRSGCTSRRRFSARFAQYTPTERQNGLTGLGNAFRTIASLLLMCDPRDLGVALTEDISGGLLAWEPDLLPL